MTLMMLTKHHRSGLEMLDAGYTTNQKMQNLLNNLQFSPSDNYLISHCRDTFTTFEECITYLRKEAVQQEDVAGRSRKGMQTEVIKLLLQLTMSKKIFIPKCPYYGSFRGK